MVIGYLENFITGVMTIFFSLHQLYRIMIVLSRIVGNHIIDRQKYSVRVVTNKQKTYWPSNHYFVFELILKMPGRGCNLKVLK